MKLLLMSLIFIVSVNTNAKEVISISGEMTNNSSMALDAYILLTKVTENKTEHCQENIKELVKLNENSQIDYLMDLTVIDECEYQLESAYILILDPVLANRLRDLGLTGPFGRLAYELEFDYTEHVYSEPATIHCNVDENQRLYCEGGEYSLLVPKSNEMSLKIVITNN